MTFGGKFLHYTKLFFLFSKLQASQISAIQDCTQLTVKNENDTLARSWTTCVNQTDMINQGEILVEENALESWKNVTNYTNTDLDQITQNTTLYVSEGKLLCMNQTKNNTLG